MRAPGRLRSRSGWTPLDADCHVRVFRSSPRVVFILDGEQVFRLATALRTLARWLGFLPAAQAPPQDDTVRLERLGEDAFEIARVVLSGSYGTAVSRPGWKVTWSADGESRSDVFWHSGDPPDRLSII